MIEFATVTDTAHEVAGFVGDPESQMGKPGRKARDPQHSQRILNKCP